MKPQLPDGIVAVVKHECPTCVLVEPVLADLDVRTKLTVYTQDDPAFPADLAECIYDVGLLVSWHHDIETVPTLIRVENGKEAERIVGWHRGRWEALTGEQELGLDLPDFRPGCGSLSVDPDKVNDLAVQHGGEMLKARRIHVGEAVDPVEAAFARGWSDGLPVVPPIPERVVAMLEGTTREPSEIVAVVPPDLVECTVEKVAINAVMAGCRSEYLPVVLAAVEAACNDTFNMHGLLATTMPVAPVIVVNGPIRKAIGMNSGKNVFGQGNRANSTIGRALQLVVRNVGGGRPGEGGVDRAAFGQPGKVGLCFAEDEEGSPWAPLNTDFGYAAGSNTVTVFAGEAPRSVTDQLSRDPESLARTLAECLRTVHHPKLVMAFDGILAIGPEHSRVFREAEWDRAKVSERINELTATHGSELVRGAGGMAEGIPDHLATATISKFRPGGLMLVHCGGGAGLFSAIIGGWVNGEMGSAPVCHPISN